jgi:hypothetical protein
MERKREFHTGSARPENLRMRRNSWSGNQEIPLASAPGADRPEKVTYRTSGMHACGKSDGLIVPAKPPNKGMRLAEVVEGRGLAKGNTRFRITCRTQCRVSVLLSDPSVREAASAASAINPRWEPYAGNPLVRFCAGGWGQPQSLPRRLAKR